MREPAAGDHGSGRGGHRLTRVQTAGQGRGQTREEPAQSLPAEEMGVSAETYTSQSLSGAHGRHYRLQEPHSRKKGKEAEKKEERKKRNSRVTKTKRDGLSSRPTKPRSQEGEEGR